MAKSEVYEGDCALLMDSMAARGVRADVVVGSPPYNIGTQYHQYVDYIPWSAYFYWMRIVGRSVRGILNPKGSFFVNMGSKPSDPMGPFGVVQALTHDDLFTLQNVIYWIKSISISEGYSPTGQPISVGNYKPLNSPRYVNDCVEMLFHFTLNGDVELDRLAVGVPYADASNQKRWAQGEGSGSRCRGNAWFIPYSNRQKKLDHPATFPVELPKQCILLHGLERTKLVLDPWCGVSTTGVACRELGVDYIGIDIDKVYIEASRRNLEMEA